MMPNALLPLRRAARAGFTLIELLAVIMIIGILAVFLLPRIPEAIDAGKVTACRANMGEIYKGMLIYKNSFNAAPNESGVKFFAELISTDTLENTKSAVIRMTCPGVEYNALGGLNGRPEIEWYKDLAQVDGTYSAYAGRNTKEFPLRKFPGSGKEALVADDNDGPSDDPMNHRHTTLCLMADGSVQTYELALLKKSGVLGEDDLGLLVGPESPVEELRKLSLD